MKNLRKLNRLLINPAFQVSVIAWFAAVALAVIGTFFAAIVVFFRNLRQQGYAAELPAEHPLFQYIQAQELQLYQIFAVGSVVAILIIVAGGLWLSHRVAGPLSRLTHHLRASSPRSTEPVQFRDGDYFPELQDAFNEYLRRG